LNYSQYFIKGQKIILKPTDSEPDKKQRHNSIFAVVSACIDSTLELSFPEPFSIDTDLSFSKGQSLKVLSENQGMGVSILATFREHYNDNTIRLSLSGDLNHFNRRRNHRIELELSIGLEESPVSRSIIQERWTHQVRQLRKGLGRPTMTKFADRTISLSTSGLGMSYPSPAKPGHYFMIYLELENSSDLICAVGEIVRCEPGENNSFFIGLHFDYIEEADQQRIAQFVNHYKQRH
jgi:c-di-GMP-binding flagellar brake protein YcgR